MHAGSSFSYSPISVLLRQPLSIKRAMQERYNTSKKNESSFVLVSLVPINEKNELSFSNELGLAISTSFLTQHVLNFNMLRCILKLVLLFIGFKIDFAQV
jgi:hypothetical protein